MNPFREPRAWLANLTAAALGYWLILLIVSLPLLEPPPVLVPLLVAGALPVLVAGAITLWRHSPRSINTPTVKDDLTGLANRRAFRDKAAVMLGNAAPGTVAIVMLDVDGLRKLNDSCGHQAGDELLLRFTEQLTRIAPDPSCVYRLGGDEFAILIDRSAGHGIANVVGQLDPVTALFASCGHQHTIDVSYGFASNLPAEGIDTLFKRADERLRDYKRRQYSSGELPDRRGSAPATERDFDEAGQPTPGSNITSIQDRRRSRTGR